MPIRKTVLLGLIVLSSAGCFAQKPGIEATRDPEELFRKGADSFQKALYPDAEKAFKLLMEDHPLSPYGLEGHIMLADLYYTKADYEDAASYYGSFATMHPSHPKAPYAAFQKGMSHFKEVLGVDRDQTSTRKALFAFEDLLKAYPDSPYTEKTREMSVFLKERLAEREFYIGEFYFRDKNYKGALVRFKEILANYPDSGLLDKTLFYIGMAYEELGEKGLAQEAFATLIKEYPESPYAEDAKDMLDG